MTHYELCKITAERFINDSTITLYEYQSYATGEFPDVLCFKDVKTTLFEIKVDYQDFKNDVKKECRIEKRIKYGLHYYKNQFDRYKLQLKKQGMEDLILEAPHLGWKRYYVCPKGLIQPEEISNGWGLYWYNGRFFKKKESKTFKNNIYDEMRILAHAFRKYACESNCNVLVNKYK
jgi:hypothetical protein